MPKELNNGEWIVLVRSKEPKSNLSSWRVTGHPEATEHEARTKSLMLRQNPKHAGKEIRVAKIQAPDI